MRLHEYHREIAGVLALYGIRPEIEPTKGGHVRFKWKAGHLEQTLLTSKTPSDWRTRRNAVARVRRMLQKAGVTKIAPCRSVLDQPTQRPIAPTSTAALEARVTQLEQDMQMLMDIITTPAAPRPPEIDEIPVEGKKKRGRRPSGWLWGAMRYDQFMKIGDIAEAAGRPEHTVSVSLTYWKAKGYLEHKRGIGWRKRPKVEELDRANGHANGHHRSAAH